MAKIFDFPYRTVAEINLQALVKNVVSLRTATRREVIPVIKADAYGHGAIPVAKVLLGRAGCEAVAVATLEEGIELRNHFHKPFTVLVLSGFLPHQVEAYERYNLTPVIHNLNHLKALRRRAHLPPLHLKIDTGMNRLGIKPTQMDEVAKVLGEFPDKLSGFCTHLADSDDWGSAFLDEQISLFEYWFREFKQKKLLNTDARIHYSNSGAMLRKKVEYATAVRPGITIYGETPFDRKKCDVILYPVLQWKTRVLAVKTIAPGETVGYGRTFKAEKGEKIAILSVGYADGYPRIVGNTGEVLIRGQRARVCGRVSMDLTTVLVTGIEGVKDGDVAMLIGRDGKDEVRASEVAKWAKTISYEIFCGISGRVQRVYFDSDAT